MKLRQNGPFGIALIALTVGCSSQPQGDAGASKAPDAEVAASPIAQSGSAPATAPVAAHVDPAEAAAAVAAEKEKVSAEEKAAAAAKVEAEAEKAKAAADAAAAPAQTVMAPPASFARCSVCHDVTKGGPNKLGPNLYGTYGKAAGVHAGFNYSAVLKAAGLRWDDATLDKWLDSPRALVPGNSMSFPGMKDPAKRKEIIDYLKTLK
jgi:cytochrome c